MYAPCIFVHANWFSQELFFIDFTTIIDNGLLHFCIEFNFPMLITVTTRDFCLPKGGKICNKISQFYSITNSENDWIYRTNCTIIIIFFILPTRNHPCGWSTLHTNFDLLTLFLTYCGIIYTNNQISNH